jgi:SAM-dependent methyltransferase
MKTEKTDSMIRLNLGCGPDIKKGFINVDNMKYPGVDKTFDLEKTPYPFKTGSVDYIYASHVLEHLDDTLKILHEWSRILRTGGIIHIRVPHFSNGFYYNDPTHKKFFGWFTFDRLLSGYAGKAPPIKVVQQRYNFLSKEFPKLNAVLSIFHNILPKGMYERFFAFILPVGEVEIKLRKY